MSMMRSRQAPSSDDKLLAIHAQLVQAVEDLMSSDAWIAMLRVAARFTTYSPSNILLIAAQRPDATQVAGIRTWNALGRRVVKGEHGIAILAPCLYRQRDESAQALPSGSPSPEADEPTRVLHGFKVVHVFDVAQTTGDDLPDTEPTLLRGDAPAGLWDHLARLAADDGYALERGPCPLGVNGFADPAGHRVRVRVDLDPAHAAKTLAHELGHIRADHPTRFPGYLTDFACRGQAEVEAESVAYIVMTHAGVAAEAYSTAYIAGWSFGDPDAAKASVAIVVTTARSLLLGGAMDQRPSRRSGPEERVEAAISGNRTASAEPRCLGQS
ncbi:ArdC-like ssDNA-binding domain-containing protein [Cellulomonas septica]|uniref:N-terminal domain-containing protein n=1 Tax=Cellulomonas septica TaxID=285080 RepID=A0ABX1JXG9_9CELL|nr:ArdC-like ssDNA-binding domain-containing protein [Cellulomonas septica]NKY38000.1 hypothetical protein [Cellulomonas septica]